MTASIEKLQIGLYRSASEIASYRVNLPADPAEGLKMNDERAEYAAKAVLAYIQETGADADTAIRDLLGSIQHLCPRLGLNFDEEMACGNDFYTFETGQQDDPGKKQQQRSRA